MSANEILDACTHLPCGACYGQGGRTKPCTMCGDSTFDHECNDEWIVCVVCHGTKRAPNPCRTCANNAAAQARVDGIEEAANRAAETVCDCAFAPCQHDEMRRAIVECIRRIMGPRTPPGTVTTYCPNGHLIAIKPGDTCPTCDAISAGRKP